MAKTTKFKKVASGGVDKGSGDLNGFGMLPVTQKSPELTGTPTSARVAVAPEDGADILQIRHRQQVAVAGSGAVVSFRLAGNATSLVEVTVTAIGDYVADKPSTATAAAWFNVAEGTQILASADGAAGTFTVYTTWLQPLADS